MVRVIILGAASAIAEATARLYAKEGADLLLVGRQREKLEAIAADLKLRGAARAEVVVRDLASEERIHEDFASYIATLGGLDHVILAYGILGDQPRAERDAALASESLRINFTSPAAWSLAAAEVFERQKRGALVVIGSVAGDRGRRANYIYGAGKAGLAALIEGIGHRFALGGARSVIVKPGPVITPMTAGFPKREGFMWSTPEQVGAIVHHAAYHGDGVVYAPWFWRFIMLIIRFLPLAIYKRVNI